MAIVDNACFGLRASGNLGDLNYYISRGRQIARSRKTTGGTPSAAQIVIQGYLQAAVSYWRNSITSEQRREWEKYAEAHPVPDRLGRVRVLPAYNVYCGLFVRAKVRGATPVSDPPGDILLFGFTGYYIDWVPALSYFRSRPADWFNSAQPDGFEWWIAGPFDSELRQAQENEFYMEKYKSGIALTSSSAKTPNKWYWHRLRWAMEDGRSGNWIQFQAESAV